MPKEKYPMAAKLRESVEHKPIVNFMEWLTEERDGQTYELCHLEPGHKWHTTCIERIDDLIFEYLGIDPKKLDQERRQMLQAP